MFKVGDIVKCFAPIAGHIKYHLLIVVGESGSANQFLFINSDPNFQDTYAVDCHRLPMLPSSRTGKSAFSFSMISRYTNEQLGIYRAEKIGDLPLDIGSELLDFVDGVQSLTRKEKLLVKAALVTICERG